MLATRRRGLSADCGSWNTIWTWRRRCSAASALPVDVAPRDARCGPRSASSSPTISRAKRALAAAALADDADELVLVQREADIASRAANSARRNSPPRGEALGQARTLRGSPALLPAASTAGAAAGRDLGRALPARMHAATWPAPTSAQRRRGLRALRDRRSDSAARSGSRPLRCRRAGPASARAAHRAARRSPHRRVGKLQAARVGMRRARRTASRAGPCSAARPA